MWGSILRITLRSSYSLDSLHSEIAMMPGKGMTGDMGGKKSGDINGNSGVMSNGKC